MKAINKKMQAVFEKVVGQMVDGYTKIDNSNGSYMALTVEDIGGGTGRFYSLSHYFVQNGDMMRDPEMTFYRGDDDRIYPMSYQIDSMGIYQESIIFEDGKPRQFKVRMQREHKDFANQWLENIKYQQNI